MSVSDPGGQGAQAPRAAGTAAPDSLDRLWDALLADWSDERRHDRFIAACALQGQLPFAGHCYRGYLDAHPGDRLAERGKQRVLAQAMALLQSETVSRRDWRGAARVVRIVSALVIALATAALGFFFLNRLGR